MGSSTTNAPTCRLPSKMTSPALVLTKDGSARFGCMSCVFYPRRLPNMVCNCRDENCPSPGARADSIAYPGVTNFAPDGFNDSFKSVKCIRE